MTRALVEAAEKGDVDRLRELLERGTDVNSPQEKVKRRIIRDIAHARAGDKGNISSVCVWVFDPKDYPILQGIFLFLTVSVVLANLLADLIYGLLDPRVRV